MPKTKRIQVLMEPEEFYVIEQIAKKRGSSVSDLMREAARAQLFPAAAASARAKAAHDFLSLAQPSLPPWKTLKREIEDRRG
jgi:Ribbon-helix-helix protein, copG family